MPKHHNPTTPPSPLLLKEKATGVEVIRIKLTIILLAVIALSQVSLSQNLQELFGKRNEIYFSFQIKSALEIHTLTRIISIDNVKNDTVWAYANIKEFLKFSQLGYHITLLPHPGDSPGVQMQDHYDLNMPVTSWNYYPTYDAYVSLMTQFQTNYPDICKITTIATLSSGRQIIVAKISDNVNTDETEPEFLYTSSIHGDEVTGYVLMLHLIDYLLSNYGTNTEVTDLVNNMEIYINPLANPDGTYHGGNSTVNGATRGNANGVDLNRNYPDPQDGPHPDGNAWQPETVAFMDFATQHHFIASVNFHGGAEVVNYPWDTWATLAADNNWWIYVSREYADTVHMHSPSTYMDDLNNGITNGYAWYEVNGGRQDYMNYWQHCREATIELSNTKILPANLLETHWNYNWRSFILHMKEARYGIHGIVTDQVTGNPVAAKVFLIGHDIDNSEVYSSANNGDFHRLLKTGTYDLEISAPCYTTFFIMGFVVTDQNTINFNIQLPPGAGVTTTPASSITMSGAVSGGEVICDGGSTITARGVCWGTSANPTIAGSHTTDGSGLGVFISNITGLSPSTLYHVRAYATNTNGTIYGADLQFTTLCATVTTFPWNEGFENGGSIPGCWTQEQVNSSGVNWVFITGNGNGHPAAAHGGTYNACLKDLTSADNKTRLITPTLNLTSITSPQLKFWHTQALWSPDQDRLTVFYKTSAGGTWTQLAAYTNNITAWAQETINLPEPGSDYYIAFEGNAKYGYGVCLDDVSVTGEPSKALNLKVYLEGLYIDAGIMRQAWDAAGPHFGAGISDQVIVELHNASDYSTIEYSSGPVNLSTSGNISITGIPAIYNGSYYITIRHRSSIETTTAVPVSFSASSISYDFSTAASQAYGSNLKQMGTVYVIYGGDATQDGFVDGSDMAAIDNASTVVLAGYNPEDINGDGIVDGSDMALIDNNSTAIIHAAKP